MKKVVLAVLCLASSVAAFSQGFSFGVKGGLNVASETWKVSGFSASTSSQAKLVGGVYATMMFTDKFGIQPELLYSGQGGKISSDGSTEKDKFTYINIPVLFRWQIIPLVHLNAGPQIGILASAKADDGNGSVDIKSQVKSSDISLAIGGGVDLPFGLNFEARFVPGLGNIAKDDGSGTSTTVKNNVWQVTVGYKLFGK